MSYLFQNKFSQIIGSLDKNLEVSPIMFQKNP